MKKNTEIRQAALAELKSEWTQPVLASLMFILIACIGAVATSGKFSIVLCLVSAVLLLGISAPMECTYRQNFLKFVRGDKEEMVGSLFDFFNRYWYTLGLALLRLVMILLWSILLIVPGVIKALSYSMAFFIAKDNPEMKGMQCLEASAEMMRGHKMELFKLYLSFIGWWALSVVTLGIGFLWLMPYVNSSLALFYEDLRVEYEQRNLNL